MSDLAAALDRCVPAQEVIARLAAEHRRRSPSLVISECEQAAMSSLLPRLRSGMLDAWAVNCRIDSSVDTGPLGVHEIVSPWDFYVHEGEARKVPLEFWSHFHNAGRDHRTFDPLTGDCSFSYCDEAFSLREGGAFAVHFHHAGLPALTIPQPEALPASPEQSEAEIAPRGRTLAEWWPDFVAELVSYAKEGLVPDGIGHQGQTAVFNEVAARLSERGKLQPNRTQCQETINAVLRRLRQPEKP